jgi:hypothetical protein
MPNDCPVCRSSVPPQPLDNQGWLVIQCPRCGTFGLGSSAVIFLRAHFEKEHDHRWITSYAIRRRFIKGRDFPTTYPWVKSVWETVKLPNPHEQADIAIEYLGSSGSSNDEWIKCDPILLGGLLGTKDDPTSDARGGYDYVMTYLQSKRIVEQNHSASDKYRLSFDGWERYEQLRRGTADTRKAFMAMGYGNPEVDKAFGAFVQAVNETEFHLERLDQSPKAGLIDNRMRIAIRAAKFVVADLTDENRGAYWEAGFAEGLDKKVHYTCEKEKFAKLKTHFDTEHHLTIRWSLDDNLQEAKEKLKAAIRNDFPAEAKLQDGKAESRS